MKDLKEPQIAKLLREHPQMGWGDETGGYFHLNNLRIIVSTGGGWDHVSVSLADRCPSWLEMCRVKEMFFKDDECVVQFHPAVQDHINIHKNCLHLWRPQSGKFPMPPKFMV